VHHWLEKYGFAFLVAMALACASYLAASVAVPHPVPDFALQAKEIYRLEIGAAFFVAFYLATLAVVLALSGKGFAELGTRGLKATTVTQQEAGRSHQESISRLQALDQETIEKLKDARSSLDRAHKRLEAHEQRLEILESKR